MPRFTADVETTEDHADVALAGPVDALNLPLLAEVLSAVRDDERVRTITVDLDEVTALADDGVIELLHARHATERAGKALRLTGGPRPIAA